MNARSFLGGQYLQKEDVSEPVIVTISHAETKAFEGEDRPKLVLYFEEYQKGLACNNTNILILIDACGKDDTDQWKGKKIVLYVDPTVMYSGRMVGGLRVRAATKEELAQDPPF